jgi:hypothetical protein
MYIAQNLLFMKIKSYGVSPEDAMKGYVVFLLGKSGTID